MVAVVERSAARQAAIAGWQPRWPAGFLKNVERAAGGLPLCGMSGRLRWLDGVAHLPQDAVPPAAFCVDEASGEPRPVST